MAAMSSDDTCRRGVRWLHKQTGDDGQRTEVAAVTSPRSDVAVYSAIGLPPQEPGAVHETTANTSLGVADKLAGVLSTSARATVSFS